MVFFNDEFMKEVFDDIELSILGELDDFINEAHHYGYKGNKLWTKRIKERIGNLGRKEFGYQVAAAGCDEGFEREWLYDLVWYVEDIEGRLKKIPLIMESEWDYNYSGIKYDFEKLLVGRADNHLLICQAHPNEIDSLFQKLKDSIDVYEGNCGDKFMIAVLVYDNDEYKFHYRSYSKPNTNITITELDVVI